MPDQFQSYLNYEVGDFLEDPDFRNLVFAPTADREKFWADFLEHCPSQTDKFNEAKMILEAMHSKYSPLDSENNKKLTFQLLEERIKSNQENVAIEVPAKRRTISRRLIAWSAAAAVIVLGLSWFLLVDQEPEALIYQTAFSEQRKITLPDESIVMLNANSTLKQYSFDQSDRVVVLQGEAYFQVSHNAEKPFRVITEDLSLEVLGTSFNVNSLREQTAVFLESGEVKLSLPSRATKELKLKPGQMASYSKKKDRLFNTQNTSAEQYLAWKDGILRFNNAPLSEVLLRLEEIYGVQFEIQDPTIKNQTLKSTGIPIAALDTTLAILEKAMGISIMKTKNNYVVKKNN